MKKIAILGAGIYGLSVAWFLKRKFQNKIELTLYEKTNRVGGWIKTVKEQDFLFERGPKGFRPRGKGIATLDLVKEIGLENELITANPQAQKRYLALNQRLCRFNFLLLLRLGIVPAIFHDLFTPSTTLEDESVNAFFIRRFNRPLAENIIDPLTRGIFGGEGDTLSVRSCFPLLWGLEQAHGSVLKGIVKNRKKKRTNYPPLYSFKEGMEQFPLRLAHKLEAQIKYSAIIDSLESIEADHLISTLPFYELSRLLGVPDPFEYTTLTTVHLGWHAPVLKKRGYGFLVPAKEKGEILGMTWDSDIFPDHNRGSQTRVTLFISGTHPEIEIYQRVEKSLKLYLGMGCTYDYCAISVAKRALVQYTLFHHRRAKEYQLCFPSRLQVPGIIFTGIGLNDSIFNARSFVETFHL